MTLTLTIESITLIYVPEKIDLTSLRRLLPQDALIASFIITKESYAFRKSGKEV